MICINCPRGCLLDISPADGNTGGEGELAVTGNFCSKGIEYARQELTSPTRVLTVLMRPEGADRPLSVRTDRPVPKSMLKECAREIYRHHPKLPVKYGQILIKDICGTGADVVATSEMD